MGCVSGVSRRRPAAGLLQRPQELLAGRAGGSAPADAARREEEPVHEERLAWLASLVGVEHEQPVPLVLLLAAAVGLRIALGLVAGRRSVGSSRADASSVGSDAMGWDELS